MASFKLVRRRRRRLSRKLQDVNLLPQVKIRDSLGKHLLKFPGKLWDTPKTIFTLSLIKKTECISLGKTFSYRNRRYQSFDPLFQHAIPLRSWHTFFSLFPQLDDELLYGIARHWRFFRHLSSARVKPRCRWSRTRKTFLPSLSLQSWNLSQKVWDRLEFTDKFYDHRTRQE